jgi:hypothetical protein
MKKSEAEETNDPDISEESEAPSILLLSKSDLIREDMLHLLYRDLTRDYYASNDWSITFYILQATRGFIAVSHSFGNDTHLILPQIQKTYCLLHFDRTMIANHRLIRKIKNQPKGLMFRVNHDFDDVIDTIHRYHSDSSWLSTQYRNLCKHMHRQGAISLPIPGLEGIKFRMCCVGLYLSGGDTAGSRQDLLVAGEIGYSIGGVFTSLTGFVNKELLHTRQKISIGLVQILVLARVLDLFGNGCRYLNMGQPPYGGHMKYKEQLGGREVPRTEFLELWNNALTGSPIQDDFFSYVCEDIQSLFT